MLSLGDNGYVRKFAGADLTYAILIEVDLSYANLTDANLNGADLSNANLSNATLVQAVLTGATFSTNTTLFDGQTVLQHGFDAAGLQTYLEFPQGAADASGLNVFVYYPEPTTLLLALLALAAVPLRVRHG